MIYHIIQKTSQVLQRLLIYGVRGYQRTLSPDHSWLRPLFPYGVCRYEPTCSEYMIGAIRLHGWYGIIVGSRRILRCHPFAKGGHDPITL